MSDPVCMNVPLLGTSDETALMAALEFVVQHFTRNFSGGELTDGERARAAEWLAAKYRQKKKRGKFIEGLGWREWDE